MDAAGVLHSHCFGVYDQAHPFWESVIMASIGAFYILVLFVFEAFEPRRRRKVAQLLEGHSLSLLVDRAEEAQESMSEFLSVDAPRKNFLCREQLREVLGRELEEEKGQVSKLLFVHPRFSNLSLCYRKMSRRALGN